MLLISKRRLDAIIRELQMTFSNIFELAIFEVVDEIAETVSNRMNEIETCNISILIHNRWKYRSAYRYARADSL